MHLLKLLEYNFSVLKQFILQYKTVEAMSRRLRDEAEITVFSSGFEKETLQYEGIVSYSVYFRDAANVLDEQISESLDEEFFHSSHVS